MKNILSNKEFKNLKTYNDLYNNIKYKPLYESTDFSNTTGWSESLVGRAFNKIFSFGKTMIEKQMLKRLQSKIVDAYFSGIMVAMAKNNIDKNDIETISLMIDVWFVNSEQLEKIKKLKQENSSSEDLITLQKRLLSDWQFPNSYNKKTFNFKIPENINVNDYVYVVVPHYNDVDIVNNDNIPDKLSQTNDVDDIVSVVVSGDNKGNKVEETYFITLKKDETKKETQGQEETQDNKKEDETKKETQGQEETQDNKKEDLTQIIFINQDKKYPVQVIKKENDKSIILLNGKKQSVDNKSLISKKNYYINKIKNNIDKIYVDCLDDNEKGLISELKKLLKYDINYNSINTMMNIYNKYSNSNSKKKRKKKRNIIPVNRPELKEKKIPKERAGEFWNYVQYLYDKLNDNQQTEAKKAYRLFVKNFHPEHVSHHTDEERYEAFIKMEEALKIINEHFDKNGRFNKFMMNKAYDNFDYIIEKYNNIFESNLDIYKDCEESDKLLEEILNIIEIIINSRNSLKTLSEKSSKNQGSQNIIKSEK